MLVLGVKVFLVALVFEGDSFGAGVGELFSAGDLVVLDFFDFFGLILLRRLMIRLVVNWKIRF